MSFRDHLHAAQNQEGDIEAPPVRESGGSKRKQHGKVEGGPEQQQQRTGLDVFTIKAKNPSIASLKKWKSATFALNATRRFRYTAKVDEEALRQRRRQRFRTSAHAVRAIHRFQEAGAATATVVRSTETPSPGPPPSFANDSPCPQGFEISPSLLVKLIQDRDPQSLQELGSAPAIASRLHTNLEKGINASSPDILLRQHAFGTNTYPRQPPRWYIAFFWDACKDATLIILMVCALLSLIFGIRSHDWK